MAKTKGYSATAKSLHWLIVVLLAAQFTVAWTHAAYRPQHAGDHAYQPAFLIRGHNSC